MLKPFPLTSVLKQIVVNFLNFETNILVLKKASKITVQGLVTCPWMKKTHDKLCENYDLRSQPFHPDYTQFYLVLH